MLPFPWAQGEHMSVTGDTGTGKTTLCARLLMERTYTLALRSKADKSSLPGKLVRTASAFSKLDHEINPRVLLDPKYETQAATFHAAFETVWKEGGWTVYLDELYYLTSQLKLERYINRLLTQGRSMGITVVSGMQRPVLTTRFAMSQATHLISFRCEGRDVRTLMDVGGEEWARAVAGLERFQFAWYYRPERAVWVGRLQDLPPLDIPKS